MLRAVATVAHLTVDISALISTFSVALKSLLASKSLKPLLNQRQRGFTGNHTRTSKTGRARRRGQNVVGNIERRASCARSPFGGIRRWGVGGNAR